MQLDQTRIAIRERGYLDLLDLSLRLVRAHGASLLACAMPGMLVAIAVNAWLMNAAAGPFEDNPTAVTTYFWILPFLVVFELPLVMVLPTLYLGQALFVERPNRRQMGLDLLRSLPQLLLFQVFLRALLLPWGVTWFLLFATVPYLNEVILLERNPLIKRRGRPGLTTWSRAWSLHARNTGELFARWLGSLFFAPLLIVSLWMSLHLLRGLLTAGVDFDRAFYLIELQVAVWLVALYFTIVRFLSYLDLRIRNEGWEVELRMRAEGARLARQVA
ncbi:MAG: hypothetical protein KF708_01175 [Pirellulales bacterium]|nr:hypothetical protein [Pirellulales bacterium]